MVNKEMIDYLIQQFEEVFNFMKETIIFSAYPPHFPFSVTLWDISISLSVGAFFIFILGFGYDDD